MPLEIIGRRYELQKMIGQGGMGAVYAAFDRLNRQTVALKRVVAATDDRAFSSSYNLSDFRLALAREFKFLASIRHPYVIEVLDYGFDAEQQPYYTMELLADAQTILAAGRALTQQGRLRLLVQMLQALAYLHRRGILHRDLKPANVLVTGEQLKLLDFGLSTMHDRVGQDEPADTTVGTLSYMAPEVLVGNGATACSDLYAVGIIAYELLAGVHPFGAASDPGILVNHILHTVPDPENAGIAEDIALILRRLLQKQPEDRYADAQAVLAALDVALGRSVSIETSATRESFLQAANLVGRDAEVADLSAAFEAARAGQGSVWLIAGESGVGKSRLLDEVRAMAMVSGALVMRGEAQAEERIPYRVWRPVLRWMSLLDDLTTADLGLIHQLAPDVVTSETRDDFLVGELEPQQIRAHLLHLLDELLGEHGHPVIIILEDLHWAGSESIALLADVIAYSADRSLMVIGSYRDDERNELSERLRGASLLKLRRLDEASIAALSHAMLGEVGRQAQVVNLLQRETEGNVYFLIEVVRALAEEAGTLDEIGKMTLPENVFAGGMQLIIQRRLEQVPEWGRDLLHLAAVIGRRPDLALLGELDPTMDLDRWLLVCANASVLEVQDGEWQFIHDKLRDGLLDELDAGRQRQLHRRVAEAIEHRYPLAEWSGTLAFHWRLAGDVAKEVRYIEQAGDQSLRSGAFHEAVSAFERALLLIERADLASEQIPNRRIELLQRQAAAYLGTGSYDRAEALYRQALQAAEQSADAVEIGRVLAALGDVAYVRGDHSRAREFFQESLANFRAVDERTGIARALHSLGNVAYDVGDHNIARQLYKQSLDISRELRGQWGMAGALTTLEVEIVPAPASAGQVRQIVSDMELYVEQSDREGVLRTLRELSDVTRETGDYATAERYFEIGLAYLRATDDRLGLARVLTDLGTVALAARQTRRAAQHMRAALRASIDTEIATLTVLLEIARLLISLNARERALELLAGVLHHPDSDGVEDACEQLAFELQAELDPQTVKLVWDRGKSRPFDEAIAEVLEILNRQ